MQRHKRFVWTWAAAGVGSVMGLLGNWGSLAVVAVPKDSTPVSFYARGATDDDRVTSLVGMGPTSGGFELNLEEVPLTTEPKRYTIDGSRVAYGKVVGGFDQVADDTR